MLPFCFMAATSYFNSRPSARGDDSVYAIRAMLETISIHAPPRGATQRLAKVAFGAVISIHAPPRGATRSHRGRKESPRNFNSRPSARGDGSTYAALCALGYISIHAPPRGATDCDYHGRGDGSVISIHAPPRGATGAWRLLGVLESHFNSRPSARGDGLPHHVRRAGYISIHAPPRGATGRSE